MEVQGQALTLAQIKLAASRLSNITGQKKFVLLGSGSFIPHADEQNPDHLRLTRTIDLDFGIKTLTPDEVLEISESLGKNSEFFEEHQFYVETLPESFYNMPTGWEDRAIEIFERGTIILAIAPLDLAVNKLSAARLKDIEYVAALEKSGVIERNNLITSVESIKGDKAYQKAGLLLSIGALDIIHSRDTGSYRQIAESFFEKIKATKDTDAFASMTSDALMTSAFGLEEKQASATFTMISAKALSGEISAKDFIKAVQKERTAISTNSGNAQDIAESLRPEL